MRRLRRLASVATPRAARVADFVANQSSMPAMSVSAGSGGGDAWGASQRIAESMNSVPWLAALEKLLEQKLHVPTALAQPLILALLNYAEEILGQQRHRMIESWIKSLETSDGSLEAFIKMLEPVTDPQVQRARVQIQQWKSAGS
jgi:hypothetical protein